MSRNKTDWLIFALENQDVPLLTIEWLSILDRGGQIPPEPTDDELLGQFLAYPEYCTDGWWGATSSAMYPLRQWHEMGYPKFVKCRGGSNHFEHVLRNYLFHLPYDQWGQS